jgi:capsular exopolysaccharide synthesis family protein
MGLFKRKGNDKAEKWNIRTMYGPNLNFAATEAYKLLRTNIMFSFSEEETGRVIGVTSSVQSEGKSSTACNVAYALSEAGEKVLLLEGDLRRPSLASKLGLARSPGLTNLLIAKGDFQEMVQHCPLTPAVDIITSGDIPPNPSELLASARMEKLMEELKQDYDYIVLDLPPVTVVSDTLAISKLLDGVVMVVRAGVSDRQMLAEAMRQLNMVDLRVLGFVYREADGNKKKYGYKYNKKYYKYYHEYAKKRNNKK